MYKKITFITGSMYGGGAERVMSNLAKYYSDKNCTVEIITLLNDKIGYDLPKEVILSYVSADKVKGPFKPIVWLKGIRSRLKKSKPDTIVTFFAKINLLVLIASLGLKIPVFISERNDPNSDKRSKVIKYMTHIFYPISKGVIFQTEHARNCFPKAIRQKSVVISNPIDINFNFSRRKKHNNTIVAVGKLMEQKNHSLLICAFAQITNKFPNYKLEIYGDGELKEPLKKMIQKKGLEDKVFLMGRTSEVFNVVYNAELFVLPSNYEGLSNALLEAMYLETPIVSTNCAGSNELIIDGENGRLVKVNDCNGLAKSIEETIKDNVSAVKMAQRAKSTVENFTVEKICIEWDRYFENSIK